MLKMQQTFILYLYNLILSGVEIIYVDEASADPWETKRRTWMNSEDEFKLDLPPNMSNDRKRIQMIGAISNKQQRIQLKLTRDGNNADTFESFVLTKILDYPLVPEESVIVLDLAKYHGCN
jgi:hypothetical protein